LDFNTQTFCGPALPFFYYFRLNKLPELAEKEMAKEYCR